MPTSLLISTLQWVRRHTVFLYAIGLPIFCVFLWYGTLLRPPSDFPRDSIIRVAPGATVQATAQTLQKEQVIRSAIAFRLALTISGKETGLIAGDYYFSKPESMVRIVQRMIAGDFRLTPVRITIPEGATVNQMADIFAQSLRSFSKDEFIAHASPQEGMLFPDTYFLPPNSSPDTVVATLQRTFEQKIAILEPEIRASGKPLKDIIIMASLIEKEARLTETRRTIAGILWERLRIGMPLQVDAAFLYINGKNTYELTMDDLAIDSLYNTYKYAGLPAGPIGSPGLDAIRATLTPIESPYLYYLADKNGATHYARTFDEHKRNRELYMN